MTSPNYFHVAAVIVLDDARNVVLQLRDNKANIGDPNRWGLFGGQIEPGETMCEAAAREVNEELTLPCEACDLTWFGTFQVRADCTFYSFTYPAGVSIDSAVITEGQAFCRFTRDELTTLVDHDEFAGHTLADSSCLVLAAYLTTLYATTP